MIKLTSKITAAVSPSEFALIKPSPGQGWAQLVTTPQYNGGDTLPVNADEIIDNLLPGMQTIGLTKDGTPSALFLFDPTIQTSLTVMQAQGIIQEGNLAAFSASLPQRRIGKIVMVHWCTDRRLRTRTCFDVLDEVMAAHPGILFLIFARKPIFLDILSPRGWEVAVEQQDPYLVMLTHLAPKRRGHDHRKRVPTGFRQALN